MKISLWSHQVTFVQRATERAHIYATVHRGRECMDVGKASIIKQWVAHSKNIRPAILLQTCWFLCAIQHKPHDTGESGQRSSLPESSRFQQKKLVEFVIVHVCNKFLTSTFSRWHGSAAREKTWEQLCFWLQKGISGKNFKRPKKQLQYAQPLFGLCSHFPTPHVDPTCDIFCRPTSRAKNFQKPTSGSARGQSNITKSLSCCFCSRISANLSSKVSWRDGPWKLWPGVWQNHKHRNRTKSESAPPIKAYQGQHPGMPRPCWWGNAQIRSFSDQCDEHDQWPPEMKAMDPWEARSSGKVTVRVTLRVAKIDGIWRRLCQLATFHTRPLNDGTTGTEQLLSYPILTCSRWPHQRTSFKHPVKLRKSSNIENIVERLKPQKPKQGWNRHGPLQFLPSFVSGLWPMKIQLFGTYLVLEAKTGQRGKKLPKYCRKHRGGRGLGSVEAGGDSVKNVFYLGKTHFFDANPTRKNNNMYAKLPSFVVMTDSEHIAGLRNS